jgi:predicted ATP-grasp superfamily ATP-dependent carboligase
MEKGWVLVTDHGDPLNRTSLAAVRALATGGYRAAVTLSGSGSSLAAASRFCARRVRVPAPSEGDYRSAIHQEMGSGRYVSVLPTSDLALLALEPALLDLIHKERLAERAVAAGLAVPPSRSFGTARELRAAAAELQYPVVVKPMISVFPARMVNDPTDLVPLRMGAEPVLVQPYLTEPLHAVAGVIWKGEMVAAVNQRYLRTWPPDCGGGSAAETVSPDRDLEERLTRLLQSYEGIFMVQLAGPYLIDLNLRVYGSLPLAVAGGANIVEIYCDLLRGESVDPVRARPDVFYRWLEGDLRHAARSVRSGLIGMGSAVRSLAPRAGTAHSTESIRDPGPMLERLRRLAFDHQARRRRRSELNPSV